MWSVARHSAVVIGFVARRVAWMKTGRRRTTTPAVRVPPPAAVAPASSIPAARAAATIVATRRALMVPPRAWVATGRIYRVHLSAALRSGLGQLDPAERARGRPRGHGGDGDEHD